MNTVSLGPANIQTTQLGYGCAQLFRLATRRERQRMLALAYELGIRHFDVARMYGLGQAESELGRFVAGRRDRFTIFTKFGVGVPRYGAWVARLQAIPRRLVRAIPAFQRSLRRAATHAPPPKDYSVAVAQQSLEHSLRELQTDYVDALLLHEPPAGASISDELLTWLDRQRAAGTIREFGVSGNVSDIREVLRRFPALRRIVQFPSDAIGRTVCEYQRKGAEGVVTFGVVSKIIERYEAATRDQQESVVRATDGHPLAGLAAEAVRGALRANPGGETLIASTREANLKAMVEAAESPNGSAAWFEHLMDEWRSETREPDAAMPTGATR